MKDLENMKQGNGVIANKDFMLVFFITSFLPFVRPNLPQLKLTEIKKCKRKPKLFQSLFLDHETSDISEFKNFDYDFYF